MIAAKPLHEESVRLLSKILLDQDDLRPRLTQFVIDQRLSAQRDIAGVAELEAEREQLQESIRATVQLLSGAALADVQNQLQRMVERRNEIEARLAEIKTIA